MQQGFLARLEIIDLSKLEQLIYLVDKREIDTLMKPNFTFLSHDIITRQLRNLHRQATSHCRTFTNDLFQSSMCMRDDGSSKQAHVIPRHVYRSHLYVQKKESVLELNTEEYFFRGLTQMYLGCHLHCRTHIHKHTAACSKAVYTEQLSLHIITTVGIISAFVYTMSSSVCEVCVPPEPLFHGNKAVTLSIFNTRGADSGLVLMLIISSDREEPRYVCVWLLQLRVSDCSVM